MKSRLAIVLALALLASCDQAPLEALTRIGGVSYSPAELQALGQETEQVIGSSFGTGFWAATQWSSRSMPWSTIADEISSSWANWGMRDMSSEPRIAWNNSLSYSREEMTQATWDDCYAGIAQINEAFALMDQGLEIGVGGVDTERARAFGHFVRGLCHGNIAMRFDKGYLLTTPVETVQELPQLVAYTEILQAAIADLEEAQLLASTGSPFTLPFNWMNVEMDNVEFAALARAYMMRYLANSARDPNERALADWGRILTLFEDRIGQDFAPLGNDNGDIVWLDAMKFYGQEHRTWARADYRTIGPADESGGYQAWLETPVQDRNLYSGFDSSDRRIVGPGGPEDSGTDFLYVGVAGPFPSSRGTYHYSSHTHQRYAYYQENNSNGAMPTLLVAELDLLRAEALLRTGGDPAVIAELINRTRVVRGQLEAATGASPIGSPEDPQSHLPSASLWSMLKHEMRIETFATAGGLAYYLDRGWGDLVSGTPVHFPVPPTQLEVLFEANYTFGGVGGIGSAPKRWISKVERPSRPK
ncbi:MAG: hypothetical protein HKN29_16445 [Rhodothermales bacterium]|nr:hypothetical protein [Rhodothermales bacterium]